ncbi:fused FliR family export protein/FlhB family type III secretion system protein [Clostridium botulinum]|uniref:fused FliR family export protein/FlhB family type III secretion system protein n=1 Tax=Clostridium botulinum TaxID=1491 RepID=UPI0013F06854|nr:fused FliR family export protein/FlhB family type III secretion system protein [Clostridium botulinum]NFH68675.1 fused FliR family export protein/FlhB family type III secretion system protein [Clostridium botulinum]NFN79535.1 fused FliR family export protein/FlhB family type III secretion system protein [Clostridium botulinum]NFO99615.1 fused FliR family export protein/FlhB family type III secretion system protein [Clostridium botulinum]NFT91284.1 fused FliR family export protein/FlhB family
MIETAYFLALFFIFLRLTSYFVIVNAFFQTGTPHILKGALSLIISIAVIAGVDYSTVNEINNVYYLIIYGLNEVMTGLVLGFITNMIFEVVKFAGSWMDIHAGFSMVSVLDPTSHTQSTLIGNFAYMIATVIFFIVDGHHIVIKLLIESFRIVPIGETLIYQETMMAVISTITEYFVLGVKIAIPIVLIIVITDLCLGLISRTVPTIPIMIFGLPIKNLLGLITFVILLPLIFKIVSNAVYNLADVFEHIFRAIPAIPLVLIFADEKTEEATPKKKSDSKKKGQVARSKDVSVAITMAACTLAVSMLWGSLVNTFKGVLTYFLAFPSLKDFNELTATNFIAFSLLKVATVFLPFALAIMISGVAASIIQTGFMITGEPLKPSLGKLNPLKGLKNMFSKRSLVGLIKNVVVVTIISILAYKYVKNNYVDIINISNLYLPSLGSEIKNLVVGIFMQITLALVIIGATDYFVQFRLHNKELKMTKQEIKDEYKQAEGDPQLKAKIKQKQREMGMRRMMQSVSDATVVITNPTHLAIALKYEEGGNMEAPKVVAKGADNVALRLKTIAKDNDVPIVENKPLARLMYDRVEIDQDIPQDLYQGVAEVLAIVLKLKKNS